MAIKKRLSKMKSFDKYFLAGLMALCLAGSAHAQNTRQNRRRAKTEKVANDTTRTQTITHATPFISLREPYVPTNPKVKFSRPDESFYIELESFTNTATNDVKCVFSPLVVIKPFIRFNDKLDIGITTTQMVQNYTSDKMTTLTHDMYAYTKLRTRAGDFTLKAGKFSAMNYAADFLTAMSINNFFINTMYFKSGHYYPRAIIGGFKNDEMGIQVGYAEENNNGFIFNGNGGVVIASEAFIEDALKGGVLVTIGKDKTVIDFQMTCTPNKRNALLLEVVNIGNQTGFHGTYKYTGKRGNIDLFINGFKQKNDGIAGGAIGMRHRKSGTYATIGATYHDPMQKDNENYDKFTPYAEFGIVYGFSK
jgi:hypothetical protein